MANPLIRSAAIHWPNSRAGSGTDLLTGLANGASAGLGIVSLASFTDLVAASILTPLANFWIPPLVFQTGGGASGQVDRWLLGSLDGTQWAGNVNPGLTSVITTAWEAALVADLTLMPMDTLQVGAATSYAFDTRNVAAVMAGCPTYLAMIVRNRSGAALNNTAINFNAVVAADGYQL